MNGGLRWFGTTWRWVIIDRIFILGWTIPLTSCELKSCLFVRNKSVIEFLQICLKLIFLDGLRLNNIFFLLLIMFKTNGFGLFAWDQCHFLVKIVLRATFICLFVVCLFIIGIILLSFTLFYERKYHPGHSENIPYMWYDRDCERFLWFFSDTCIVKTDILLWFGASNILDFCCFTHTFVTPVWSHTAAAGVCVYVYVFLYVWVP